MGGSSVKSFSKRCNSCAPLRRPQIDELVEQRQFGGAEVYVFTPQAVGGEIGGCLVQEGTQITDGAGLVQTEETHIRFLGHLARLLIGTQLRQQEANQRFVVLAEQPLDDGYVEAALARRIGGDGRGQGVFSTDAHIH